MSACMSGTRGSGVLSSTGDVLVRGVGGVCDMCVCLARGGMGGEGGWMRELGLGFTIPVGTGGVYVFWLGWCMWGVGRGLGPGSGAVVLCLCEVISHSHNSLTVCDNNSLHTFCSSLIHIIILLYVIIIHSIHCVHLSFT